MIDIFLAIVYICSVIIFYAYGYVIGYRQSNKKWDKEFNELAENRKKWSEELKEDLKKARMYDRTL